MLSLDDDAVAQLLDWPGLIAAIEMAMLGTAAVPPRQNYDMAVDGGASGRLLIMPAWERDEVIGIKIVTVWPDNPALGHPSHGASYILIDPRSGEIRAVLKAEALTHRRTAAVSVIAASRLLSPDAERLLVVGTGPVAEQLVRAHATSGRFTRIDVFGRSREKTIALTDRIQDVPCLCRPAFDLEYAARRADMIASATAATKPLIAGAWLRRDAYVDLIGGFTPGMRESDDDLITGASQIWVDTRVAIEEAGDLIQPISRGLLTRQAIHGDLGELLAKPRDERSGRAVFKAVGTASADLAAARLVIARFAQL